MSALSDLTKVSGTSTTTLPSWYDQAQQNLVQQGQQAFGAAPQLSGTVAQNAINTLSSPNNPFTQAGATLGSIAQGAANPWLVDASGNVTPNTGTALGGLFQAQNQQLQQMIPNIIAKPGAAAIGSGQFGSLRGQTAADKAIADAQANLFASQMQAALQNQQTGVSAATGQSNVGQQGITNAMNVGQTQMASPFTNVANLGNILASIQAPATVSTTQTPSVLQQLGGLGSLAQGVGNVGLGTIGGIANQTIGGLIKSGIGSLFSSSSTPESTMTLDNLQSDLDSGVVIP